MSGAPPAGPGGRGIRPRSGPGCPGILARPGWNVRVGGSRTSGGAGPTRWGKGGTQNQGQEELIRRQPRRARGHNRAEGLPGTAPSLPRINREGGKGGAQPWGRRARSFTGWHCPLLPSWAPTWQEAGGRRLATWAGALSIPQNDSSSHGTYIGKPMGQGGEKAPPRLSGK